MFISGFLFSSKRALAEIGFITEIQNYIIESITEIVIGMDRKLNTIAVSSQTGSFPFKKNVHDIQNNKEALNKIQWNPAILNIIFSKNYPV